MDYGIFKDLAIIFVAAKFLGILARKVKAPQVVGEIIAGLLIGPTVLGLVDQSSFLNQMAEIGVVLLMFMAGLETDLKELIKTGPMALLVATAGVFIPLGGGFLLSSVYHGFAPVGSEEFFRAVFIGVIMTATSVSITVETLRELGKLRGKVGTTILSAAIIDDVIGIIVMTFVIGFRDPEQDPLRVVLNTGLFFGFAFVVGILCYYLFKYMDKKNPHTRRVPIYGMALCFAFAYVAEEWFGIADITGAYIAGIILCSIKDSKYIAEKMDISTYMVFAPVFFASIGLKADISGLNGSMILFSVGFVFVALITKIIGCSLVAKCFRFSAPNALKVGVGMMTRGEVALIVARKGEDVGLLDAVYFAPVILLIIISSIVTPIVLKLLFSKWPAEHGANEETAAPAEQN
ncbi:MAG: cation:proton antiporter [Lachnospiraceae bacterium]|nr:cation:proton antiporter [Lachnospiraceae bacterium]